MPFGTDFENQQEWKKSSLTLHILERPKSNLFLLVDGENMSFPNEEPKIIDQDVLTSWEEPDEEAVWWRNIKLFEPLMDKHYF